MRPQMGPSCCQGAATDSAFGGWRVGVGKGPRGGAQPGWGWRAGMQDTRRPEVALT